MTRTAFRVLVAVAALVVLALVGFAAVRLARTFWGPSTSAVTDSIRRATAQETAQARQVVQVDRKADSIAAESLGVARRERDALAGEVASLADQVARLRRQGPGRPPSRIPAEGEIGGPGASWALRDTIEARDSTIAFLARLDTLQAAEVARLQASDTASRRIEATLARRTVELGQVRDSLFAAQRRLAVLADSAANVADRASRCARLPFLGRIPKPEVGPGLGGTVGAGGASAGLTIAAIIPLRRC